MCWVSTEPVLNEIDGLFKNLCYIQNDHKNDRNWETTSSESNVVEIRQKQSNNNLLELFLSVQVINTDAELVVS